MRVRTFLAGLVCVASVPVVGAGTSDRVVAQSVGAIVDEAACSANQLPRNDDGSTSAVPLGFTVNF